MRRIFWRGFLFVMASAMTCSVSLAQFNIIPVPAGAVYLRSQLWNLSVSNTSGSTVEARIQMDMRELQTNRSVMTAISSSFRLPPGMKMLQMQSLEPIQYNYQAGAASGRSGNGLLSVGLYRVCYQLMVTYGESQNTFSDECVQIEVEPLSPPLLTAPENDSVVHTANPVFTWTPPTPPNMFTELQYDLLISLVNDGQSSTDAIQKNLPVQQTSGLSMPSFNYPMAGIPLEPGKKYAWQVIARDGQQYACRSEVWTFRTGLENASSSVLNKVYIIADDKPGGISQVSGDVLNIKLVSYDALYAASIRIQDENGSVIQSESRQIRQGDNYLEIPISGRLKSGIPYTVIIQSPSGKARVVSFIIKKS